MALRNLILAPIVAMAFWSSAQAEPLHALAMHGKPALQAGFPHMPYANPDAPKGGRVTYAWEGSFDSLNPFIVQGDGVRGLFDVDFGNTVFETLLMRSRDEAFTLYPLLAESIETDDARSYITFHLNPLARFSDGKPVTVDDVIFSLELFRDRARPIYRRWVNVIAKMEKIGEHSLKLSFNEQADRESPLLLAQMPILPRHAIDPEQFEKSSLKPMIGSGPYVVDSVRPGELLVLKRDKNYWGKDQPTKLGFDNYDEIRVNYFRDPNAMFEAFKKGLIDILPETNTTRWATGYNFPAVQDGRVVKESFVKRVPSGMYGYVLNTRRPIFKDRAVRIALGQLFDFEWVNRNLFAGAYQRTRSYFDGSELSSFGRPASEAEKALLAPYPDAVLPEIMNGAWQPAISDGSGRDRDFLKQGFETLKQAGYQMVDGRMIGPDGKQLKFEILLNGKSGEQISVAWQNTLARIGIEVTIRSVDAAQYLQRQRTYDFDAMLMNYQSSLSPGVEQQFRWGSASANAEGTYNFSGASEPVLDDLIATLVSAKDEDEFETTVRAFDRVLLSGAYVVPLYFQPNQWFASWSRIGHLPEMPLYGVQLPTWWHIKN